VEQFKVLSSVEIIHYRETNQRRKAMTKMLTDHQCHIIANSCIDAEFDAYNEGKRPFLDYTPLTWQRSRATGLCFYLIPHRL
jgi:hypothetical protein